MSKPFNSELHKDIIALKKVAVVMGPNADFRHMFRSIMRVHNISRTTVYNELAKDYPGTYQPPGKQKNDPPFSSEEITAVKDLLFNRIPANTIVKTMSSLLGFRYSKTRLDNVKKFIKNGVNQDDSIPGNNPDYTRDLMIQNIFKKLSGFDLSDKHRVHAIELDGMTYHVNSRVIKDCLLHIAASAATGGKDISEVTRFDMETILLNEIDTYKHNIRHFSPADIRQLNAVRLTLYKNESKNNAAKQSLKDNFNDVCRIVKHFAPNALRRDIARIHREVTQSSVPAELPLPALNEDMDESIIPPLLTKEGTEGRSTPQTINTNNPDSKEEQQPE